MEKLRPEQKQFLEQMMLKTRQEIAGKLPDQCLREIQSWEVPQQHNTDFD